MKLKATCNRCDREFLVEQAVASGGACPSCGRYFQKDYAAVLVAAMRSMNASADVLEDSLEKLAELRPGFSLDLDGMFAGLGAKSGRGAPTS